MGACSLRITLDGIPDLVQALTGIPGYIRDRIERAALEEAAQVVLDEIQARAPRKSGRMAKEIESRSMTVAGAPSVVIRPAYNRSRIAHIIEWGAKPHGKHHPGFHARNFFNGAVDATATAAQDIVAMRVRAGIDAYWLSVGGVLG